MRSFLLFLVVPVGLCACEQRFSENPPPLAPDPVSAATSPAAAEPLRSSASSDAGRPRIAASHAMVVTACSASAPCPTSEADAAAEATYHVVFGSGRGLIRSRGQAMTDLYQELRDRTQLGERLDAEIVRTDAGAPSVARGGEARGRRGAQGTAAGSDPIAQCAFRLLDLVDGSGGVTLDVVHWTGANGCTVSLGSSAAGGASQCLVQGPERSHRPSGRGAGFSF